MGLVGSGISDRLVRKSKSAVRYSKRRKEVAGKPVVTVLPVEGDHDT